MIKCNIGLSLQIQGWMEPAELLWLAATATTHNNICEIGSWMGKSTRALVDNTPGTVTAVDTWQGTPGNDAAKTNDPEVLFAAFKENMADLPPGKLEICRADSLEAALMYSSLCKTFDMVFIDANHTYESVKADIQAWLPLVENKGILCGHDYKWIWPGVVKAVNEIFPDHLMVADTIWAVQVTR